MHQNIVNYNFQRSHSKTIFTQVLNHHAARKWRYNSMRS